MWFFFNRQLLLQIDRVTSCALSVFRHNLEYMNFLDTSAINADFSLYASFVLEFKFYVLLFIFIFINSINSFKEKKMSNFFDELANYDSEVFDACNLELNRQQHNIELIASENIVSKGVLLAAGSVLTNKYAEGFPGKRYYGGCQYVDIVENLAIERARFSTQATPLWVLTLHTAVTSPTAHP